MKWKILLIILFAIIPIVYGTECKISEDNSTWVNITTILYQGCIDEADNIATIQNLEETTNYYIKCRNETTDWNYIEQPTQSGGERGMILTIIILLPILLGTFFIIGAVSLDQEHKALKLFLFLLTVPMFFISMHFGLLALIKFYDFPELEEMIGTTTYWVAWIFVAILSYFMLYMLYKGFHIAAQKKEEKLKY